jgi:hypothetical protein
MPKMTLVKSSLIDSIGYDEATKELRVKFASGATYGYRPVYREVYDDFLAAESAGKFFALRVKGHFPVERI